MYKPILRATVVAITTLLLAACTPSTPTPTAIPLPTSTPIPTATGTPTPALREYPGLVRVEKPSEIIGGMEIPPWSNLSVTWSDRLQSRIQAAVRCAPYYQRYALLPQGTCGTILGAFSDGVELERTNVGYLPQTSVVEFQLFDTKNKTRTISIDIWVLPNMVYQASWIHDPKTENIFGPLEYTTTREELEKLAAGIDWGDLLFPKKTGFGRISIPAPLKPFLLEMTATQVYQKVASFPVDILKITEYVEFTPSKKMLPGAYILDAWFVRPDTTEGGIRYAFPSRSPQYLWVLDPKKK